MSLLKTFRALDAAIMPVRCVFCGTRTRDSEGFVCVACHADLPWKDTSTTHTGPLLERLIVPLGYEFPIDAAIKALKFRRKLFYAPAFAQLLRGVSQELPDDIDAVLPVPLHWRRKWWRGFNQALEIARPLAKHLGLPLIHVARRHRATPPQSGLSAAAREKNLRRAFTMRRRVNYRHVLVIDDVVTTGATLTHLASKLRENGIDHVSAMAVARSGAR
jgi:ComF family protein